MFCDGFQSDELERYCSEAQMFSLPLEAFGPIWAFSEVCRQISWCGPRKPVGTADDGLELSIFLSKGLFP